MRCFLEGWVDGRQQVSELRASDRWALQASDSLKLEHGSDIFVHVQQRVRLAAAFDYPQARRYISRCAYHV